MVEFPRVAVFDGASWTLSVRDLVAARGYRSASGLDADVVVIAPDTDLPSAAVDAVRGGLGLVVLATGANGPDTVAPGLADLLDRGGIRLESPAAEGTQPILSMGTCATKEETAAVTDLDLLARVDPSALSGTRPLQVHAPAAVLLRTVDHRGFRGEPVAAVADLERGRIVVLSTSGAGADELLMSAITYAAGHL